MQMIASTIAPISTASSISNSSCFPCFTPHHKPLPYTYLFFIFSSWFSDSSLSLSLAFEHLNESLKSRELTSPSCSLSSNGPALRPYAKSDRYGIVGSTVVITKQRRSNVVLRGHENLRGRMIYSWLTEPVVDRINVPEMTKGE